MSACNSPPSASDTDETVRQASASDVTWLENLAFRLAESHVISSNPAPRSSLLGTLKAQETLLHDAYAHLLRLSEAQQPLSYAAEWLLDNFYVVQQALRQLREDMPESYYRQLPRLGTTALAGCPRVYALVWEVIGYCESHLDLDRVTSFVRGYQRVAPLTMGELWALPTMLRLGVLTCLSRAVGRVVELPPGADALAAIPSPLPEGMEDDVIVSGCILSLRILITQDWQAFFEELCVVDAMLRRDPAGVYEQMDFATRDRYRKGIEVLARATDRDEVAVAREALRLADEAQHDPYALPCQAHVGYYLIDAGLAVLETALAYRPPLSTRLRRWLHRRATLCYLSAIALLTLLLVLAVTAYAVASGGTTAQWSSAALLSLLPSTVVAVALVHGLIPHLAPPWKWPRLDSRYGVPADCPTLVVVPCLLSDEREIDSLLQQIELYFLGNADPQLSFALLTDLTDAPQQHMPADDALLQRVYHGIEELNKKYGQHGANPFYLLHRERAWNPGENCWMGWERKRGKLVELNRLLTGSAATSYVVQLGDLDRLSHVRYVITLDADTTLPREAAHRLIATLAHPLNRAEFDPRSGALVAGYTVLQPRVEIRPTSANRSLFARIMASNASLDLYARAVSDVYQDLFGEGTYVGKGIYDVAAFERCLAGRAPENHLLSHDLFEGIHGRAGLVTDVILLEDYPPNYLIYARRLHRWVRGDWQLLPWLLPRVPHHGSDTLPNILSPLSRWKILDNLRRSLVAPALLAFLIAAWLWLPGSALLWTAVAVATAAMPPITSLLTALMRRLRGLSTEWDSDAWRIMVGRLLLNLIFLPCEAVRVVDAIVSSLVRMFLTRRNLLQWTTSAHTLRLFGQETRIGVLWRQMLAAPLFALTLLLLVVLFNGPALPVAAPLLLVWLAAPEIAYRIGRPPAPREALLSPAQQRQLRLLARRTWLYFEDYVGPDDHWLPPDHFQESPRGLVAHRTSPTNIGLLLLSTLAAYDLGYIGLMDLVLRLRDTFEGMGRLKRVRGHLLNWYDTRSLEALPPPYISTVDSGNLAGCLLALRQGLLALLQQPVLHWHRWQGLLDTLGVLAAVVESLRQPAAPSARPEETATAAQPELGRAVEQLLAHLAHLERRIVESRDDPARWAALLIALRAEELDKFNRLAVELVTAGTHLLDGATLRDLRSWSVRVHQQLQTMQSECELLIPWPLPLAQPPALFVATTNPAVADAYMALRQSLPPTPRLQEIPHICDLAVDRLTQLRALLTDSLAPPEHLEQARAWCVRLATQLNSARMAVKSFIIGFQDLAAQAETCFQAMDFRFLFNRRRQVMAIGYNVTAGKPDENHYDLLASEARIASVVAIAKGDVPQRHWLHLSRPLTRVDGSRVLLSWNGSMFEYLMPILLLRNYPDTLLEQTNRAVVERQIDYARRKGVPWGISESGYYRFDAQQNYQYRGFGVPGLGFKRGLGEDLVIAPYASLLALPIAPQAVLKNMARLVDWQMLGHWGFYEALDLTRSRLPAGQESTIIYSYMAHHQGMVLLSLTNSLHDNVMIERFHSDLRVRSVDLLLQEQLPQRAPLERLPVEAAARIRPVQSRLSLGPWQVTAGAPVPQVHALSNGRYSLLITHNGGGASRWQDVDLTRWRADTTLDDWGAWLYVQDRDSGALWSATDQPVGSPAAEQEVLFSVHMVEFRRRDHDVTLRTEIAVLPGDDAEVRRVVLTNHSDHPRHLALTSCAEVALAPALADSRHPAFGKLFVESEYLPQLNALLLRRRPRSSDERELVLLHMLLVPPGERASGAYECDRGRLIGRGRNARCPVALEDGAGLSGTTGATLDPVMALAQQVTLEPHANVQLALLTLAAASRQEALNLAQRYRTFPAIDRAFDQARAHGERELRQLGLTAVDVEHAQQLLSLLLYPYHALRAAPATLAANRLGQAALWPFAISGDYPILLLRVDHEEDTALVQELLRAHAFWRSRQVKIDMVILNERASGYDQKLQGQLYRLVVHTGGDVWLNQRGGIFLLRADQLDASERLLLETAARAILDADKGRLAIHLGWVHERPVRLPRFVSILPATIDQPEAPPVPRPDGLLFDNGLGGMSADGREYLVYLQPGQQTPAPWVNVIAYPGLGCMVSEAGSSYTWALNSGENRLTPWKNDPLTDVSGEALYLRDEEVGDVWSPTPLPAGGAAPTLVRHGAGYSVFEHNSHGLKQQLRVFVVPGAPLKVVDLRLENTWSCNRRISATYFAEWVLGAQRESQQQHIVLEFDALSNALLARNPYNPEFGERVAFLAASKEPHGLTTDRGEFLGQGGSYGRPAALERVGLSGTVRTGLDPCAALQVNVWLAPGETEEVFFLLGQGGDRQEACQLARQYRDAAQVEAAWQAVHAFWDELLGAVTVRTPDPALDLLLNRWLLYQALSCRVWGRSALYQSSGAFGYRDQLQDVLALLDAAPDVARGHILDAARHQFGEGDVLHWWHPPSGRGIRTRCSDDLLWLPFAVAHYVAVTGDETILTERVPFLQGAPLADEEHERYALFEVAAEDGTLYEHCCRALARGDTSGAHGLPLIGSHDWNDGLNRVGLGGTGESVWLGWFLYAVLTDFAPLCERQGDAERAVAYRRRASELARAVEQAGWDGRWYRRAYDDDGVPWGAAENDECQIDSLAQSWAVLSGAGDPQRARQAMEAVVERLVREDERLVLLFAPPLDRTARDPGYVKGYVPGVRENGGQYTHAAAWVVWALAALGDGDRAAALFRLLNPLYSADTPERMARYRVEPYVVAADVYSVAPHVGRGGWAWYTGSAAWLARVGLEALLGLRRQGRVLRVEPCIPRDWPGYELRYRHGATVYCIAVENPEGINRGVQRVELDGAPLAGREIPLLDDGQEHAVRVVMGTDEQ